MMKMIFKAVGSVLVACSVSACSPALERFAIEEGIKVAEDAVREFTCEHEHARVHGEHCECGAKIVHPHIQGSKGDT